MTWQLQQRASGSQHISCHDIRLRVRKPRQQRLYQDKWGSRRSISCPGYVLFLLFFNNYTTFAETATTTKMSANTKPMPNTRMNEARDAMSRAPRYVSFILFISLLMIFIVCAEITTMMMYTHQHQDGQGPRHSVLAPKYVFLKIHGLEM